MNIESIELHDFQELGRGNTVRLDCDEKVNLLIGPNGTGKSTILRELFEWVAPVREDEDDVGAAFLANSIVEDDDQATEERVIVCSGSSDWPKDSDDEPWPAPLVGLPAMIITSIRLSYSDYQELGNFQGVVHGPFDVGMRLAIGDIDYSGADLVSAHRIPTENIEEYKASVENCFKQISPEVLEHISIWVPYNQRGTTAQAHVLSNTENLTSSGHNGTEEVPIFQTSSGTQSTLQWIQILALMMGVAYRWQRSWEKKSAILLIDEIENHLHPTWQRRVIPALLKHFPGLQIFASTHSPFVVAGLKKGQVHLLKREEEGRVVANTNTEDIVGWTADEILRTMMGVVDPTDDSTAAAARELRALRREPPRAIREEEEQRQRRMQVLRNLVDRDLLAGGPMAAQRELFEEQFSEALRDYLQSNNLNQENC